MAPTLNMRAEQESRTDVVLPEEQVSITTAAIKQKLKAQIGTPALHSLTRAYVRLKQRNSPQSRPLLLTHLYIRLQVTRLLSFHSRPVLNSNKLTWPVQNSGPKHR